MSLFKRVVLGILIVSCFLPSVEAMNKSVCLTQSLQKMTSPLFQVPGFRIGDFSDSSTSERIKDYAEHLTVAIENNFFEAANEILESAFKHLDSEEFEKLLCYRELDGDGEIFLEKAHTKENLRILMIICSYVLRSAIQTNKFSSGLCRMMTQSIISVGRFSSWNVELCRQAYDCLCVEDIITVAVNKKNPEMLNAVFVFLCPMTFKYCGFLKNSDKAVKMFDLIAQYLSPCECVQLFDSNRCPEMSFVGNHVCETIDLRKFVAGKMFEFCGMALIEAITKGQGNAAYIIEATRHILLDANSHGSVDHVFCQFFPLKKVRVLATEARNKEVYKILTKEKPFCKFK